MIKYNGQDIADIKYNGASIKRVMKDGVQIWPSISDIPNIPTGIQLSEYDIEEPAINWDYFITYTVTTNTEVRAYLKDDVILPFTGGDDTQFGLKVNGSPVVFTNFGIHYAPGPSYVTLRNPTDFLPTDVIEFSYTAGADPIEGENTGTFAPDLVDQLVENTVVSIILFEDTFNGNAIDTNKWILTNPNVTGFPITQDDQIIMSPQALGYGSQQANNLRTVDNFDFSSLKVGSFDIINENQVANNYSVGISGDVVVSDIQNAFYTARNGTTGLINITGRIGGVVEFSETANVDIQSSIRTFKFVVNQGNVEMLIWDKGWVSLYSGSLAISGLWYLFISGDDRTPSTGTIRVDNYILSDRDFDTQYPPGSNVLTSDDIDNYLIEQDNLGTSNEIIDLSKEQPRTSASDTAVANLISRNVTVITS